jgi:curved DNA-binding protein CbpA
MAERSRDPYQTLGVSPGASEEALRAAYRHQVQLHHPDHNGGSAESARRFEAVQEAYAQIRAARAAAPHSSSARTGAARSSSARTGAARSSSARTGAPRSGAASSSATGSGSAAPRADADPAVEARLADLERELREAHVARERIRAEARRVAAQNAQRPSDEELGYVTTDDSFSKILADAAAELSDRFSEAREHPAARRVSDLIDELETKRTGDPPR